jgi:hypothetical protein
VRDDAARCDIHIPAAGAKPPPQEHVLKHLLWVGNLTTCNERQGKVNCMLALTE